MIKRYNNISLALGIPGIVLQIAGLVLQEIDLSRSPMPDPISYELMTTDGAGPGWSTKTFTVQPLREETAFGRFAYPVALVGTGLLIAGLAYYAIAKGRSGLWGLCGFLSFIGLVILALLEDHAQGDA